MSSKRYDIEEEIEVTLKIKIKDLKIVNYHQLNQDEIDNAVEHFKENINEHLKFELTKKEHTVEDFHLVDIYRFNVE